MNDEMLSIYYKTNPNLFLSNCSVTEDDDLPFLGHKTSLQLYPKFDKPTPTISEEDDSKSSDSLKSSFVQTPDVLPDQALPPCHCYISSRLLDELPTCEELVLFAKTFRSTRKSLGYTQAQVGLALGVTYGKVFSRSTISRFENMKSTHSSVHFFKPLLENWMNETNSSTDRLRSKTIQTTHNLKPRRRTYFSRNTLNVLEKSFLKKQEPNSMELSMLAEELDLRIEVVRVWFFNRRQKNKKMLDSCYSQKLVMN